MSKEINLFLFLSLVLFLVNIQLVLADTRIKRNELNDDVSRTLNITINFCGIVLFQINAPDSSII